MIPIVFAINNNYVKQLATVLISILNNSDANASFEFNILHSDVSIENQKILNGIKKKGNFKINFIDVRQIVNNFDLEKLMSRRDDYKYISTETYFRFFIPQIFLQHNKIIYLDADILVMGDISEFYNEDIENYYAGVVQDIGLEVFLEDKNIKTSTKPEGDFKTYFRDKLRKTNKNYFNAGIMLMNLEKMRKDGVVEQLWQFAVKESPLEYQDQDVLNAVLENDVKYVDYKWNTLKDFNWFANQLKDKEKRAHILKTYEEPSIFHYAGSNKPWLIHDFSYNYNFIKEWWDYYKQTPFFDKKELSILKHAQWIRKKNGFKRYITIRISHLVFLDIYQDSGKLNFNILNIFKIHIRYKEPESYTRIRSI